MRAELADDLVEHLAGEVGLGMPKPCCSVVDEPRPMPNSKRPSLRWSSIATRSATRAGWFTGGVMLKMPEPMWMRSVAAAR